MVAAVCVSHIINIIQNQQFNPTENIIIICYLRYSIVYSDITSELLFFDAGDGHLIRMSMDGSVHNPTPHDIQTTFFDIDIADNMLYYFDIDDRFIKRAPLNNITTESLYTHDGITIRDIAVDWIGRYFCIFQISIYI